MPPHLRNDEAALGYNAYSILTTGKDEYGRFFPLLFQSFEDWKPGLYIYLTIPIINILGINETTIRLFSAISGILTIFLVYLITNQLFANKVISAYAAFFTAFSPSQIIFSRGAWEANTSLTFTLFGIYFFLKSFTKPKSLLISTVFFSLTFLTYHGAKVSTILILIVLTTIYYKEFRKFNYYKTIIVLSLMIALVISFPVLLSFFNNKSSRINSLSLINNIAPQTYINSILSQSGESNHNFINILYHNQFLVYLRSILWRWSEHFTLSTLFVKGDLNPQHTPPNMGPFILFDGIFVILGLIKLIRLKLPKQRGFLFLWLVLSPIPSSLTIESVNFVRSLLMFIPLIIIESLGAFEFYQYFKKNKNSRLIYCIFVISIIIYLGSYMYFIDQYFAHASKKNGAWQYGYKQMISKINSTTSNFRKIHIADGPDRPYIFFLLFGRNLTIETSRKIVFDKIDWNNYKPKLDDLYILPSSKIPDVNNLNYKVVDTIKDLDNFTIYKFLKFE